VFRNGSESFKISGDQHAAVYETQAIDVQSGIWKAILALLNTQLFNIEMREWMWTYYGLDLRKAGQRGKENV
jgi:hypothetical protein